MNYLDFKYAEYFKFSYLHLQRTVILNVTTYQSGFSRGTLEKLIW